MRGLRQNEGNSGPAAWQQGKGRRHHQRRRGLGVRHLLRLLVLVAAQQGFHLVDGNILSRFLLQPAAVVVGTLLAPQPAQAQTATIVLTATAGNGKVKLNWTAQNIGATYSGPPPCTNYAWSKWEYKQKTGSGTFGSPIAISTTRSTRHHEVTGLTNGTVYAFIVQAVYNCTAGGSTSIVNPSAAATATPTTKTVTLSLDQTNDQITEGNSGTKDVVITITLGEPAPEEITGFISYSARSTAKLANGCDAPLNPLDADACDPTGGLPAYAIAKGQTQATVTFKIIGDTRNESNETLEFTTSPKQASGLFWSDGTITLTITDDDGPDPGVTISEDSLTVTENSSATYTVVLDSDPGAQVVVTPTSSPTAKATVSGALTFTTATNNWSTAQTVTVTGVAAGTATIEHTITGYTGVDDDDIDDVEVTVNAAATIAAPVLTTATSTTSGEINLTWTHAGSSAGDFIANFPPAAEFSHWELSHRLKGATSWMEWGSSTLSGGTSLRTVAASLANTYPDGAVVEVRVNAVGTLTSGSTSYPLPGPWSNTRTVTYKNDNLDALTFSGNPVTVAVNDTATYTVKLTKAYGGVVSVTSDDTDKATVSPATLTFTTSTYNTAQTVTVTGVATGGSPQINHSFRLTGATVDAIPDAGSVGVTVGAAAAKTIALKSNQTNNSITEGNTGRKDVTLTATLGQAAPAGGIRVVVGRETSLTSTASLSTSCTTLVPATADACLVDNGVITIATGETEGTLTMRIIGDTIDEVDETLKMVSTVYNGSGPFDRLTDWPASPILTFTITDDDTAAKTIALTSDQTNNSIIEGDTGRKDVTLTATLGQAAPTGGMTLLIGNDFHPTTGSTASLSVSCTTLNPASADACYAGDALAISIAAGGRSGTVTLRIIGDTTVEEDETLRLSATAYNSAIERLNDWTSSPWLTLTIVDDDTAPAAPTGFLAASGNGEVTLSWDDPENASITGYEYQRKTTGNWGTSWTTITGSSATTTSHPVTGLTNGTAYTFRLRAVNAAGNGAVSLERTVAPTDKTITLSAAPASITEGNAGRKDVVVTATLSEAAPSGGVSITLTSDPNSRGTAQGATSSCAPSLNPADADWCAVAGFLTIAEGSQTGTKTYRILGDTRDERGLTYNSAKSSLQATKVL